MKKLLIVAIAAFAVVGLQANAKAMLVNVLIDDLGMPAAPAHISTPGGTVFALGVPNLATSRTLTGRAAGGFDLGALRVEGGLLRIGLMPTEVAIYSLAVATDFVALGQPVIQLVGLSITSALGTNLLVEMLQDGVVTGSAILVGAGPTDLSFTAAPGLTTDLAFRFTGDPLMTNAFTTVVGLGDSVVANPEPATMALIGLGVFGGAFGYRRRRKEDEVVPASTA